MKRILIAVMLFLQVLTGCQATPPAALDELMTTLKGAGYAGTWTKAESSFYKGERLISPLNGDQMIQIYRYPDAASMEQDSAGISADGSSYSSGQGAVEVDWVDMPHFYKKDNLMLLYVGRDPDVLKLLETFAGPVFAGGNP